MRWIAWLTAGWLVLGASAAAQVEDLETRRSEAQTLAVKELEPTRSGVTTSRSLAVASRIPRDLSGGIR